jgi:hypothetical protein
MYKFNKFRIYLNINLIRLKTHINNFDFNSGINIVILNIKYKDLMLTQILLNKK